MPRRASDRDPNGKRPCAICRTLRVVIVFALLVVALMAYADKLAWLKDIQFTDIFAYAIAVAFVVVLVFKTWQEYWKPKQDEKGREERREEMEKLFDEMDEAVAKREAEEAMKAAVEHHDPAPDDIVQDSAVDAEAGQPEQLDIFGYQIKDK